MAAGDMREQYTKITRRKSRGQEGEIPDAKWASRDVCIRWYGRGQRVCIRRLPSWLGTAGPQHHGRGQNWDAQRASGSVGVHGHGLPATASA